jgi:hypothetical protein
LGEDFGIKRKKCVREKCVKKVGKNSIPCLETEMVNIECRVDKMAINAMMNRVYM